MNNQKQYRTIPMKQHADKKSKKNHSFHYIPSNSLVPKFMYGENEDHRSESEEKVLEERKGSFAEEYQKNLRKTVYNETKIMLQTRKEKS